MFQEMCSCALTNFWVFNTNSIHIQTKKYRTFLLVVVFYNLKCLLFVTKGGYFSGCVEGCFVGGRTLVQTGVVNEDDQ